VRGNSSRGAWFWVKKNKHNNQSKQTIVVRRKGKRSEKRNSTDHRGEKDGKASMVPSNKKERRGCPQPRQKQSMGMETTFWNQRGKITKGRKRSGREKKKEVAFGNKNNRLSSKKRGKTDKRTPTEHMGEKEWNRVLVSPPSTVRDELLKKTVTIKILGKEGRKGAERGEGKRY